MHETTEYDLEDFDFDYIPTTEHKMRHYQVECIEAVESSWEEVDTQLVELCTGSGKTVIFSQIAERWANAGEHTLILAHTNELIDQAIEKTSKFTSYLPGKEKAEHKASVLDPIVCGSIQTLKGEKRLMEWENNHFSLIVVDEAHRTLAKSYLKVLNYFRSGGAKILGVTATADRGDKRGLGEFYQKCSYTYNLLDACKDGYLVRPIVKQMPLRIDMRGMKISRSINGADLDAEEVGRRLEPLLAEIAQHLIAEAGERKTIVFMPSIDTARRLAEHLELLGACADFVSGECKDRNKKIERYKRGDIQFICNCMLLTEGFDHDEINCVCVLRPTKIRSLYSQCIGRGTRTLTGLIDGIEDREERIRLIADSKKPNLLILDFIWLSDRLDLIKPVDLLSKGRDDIKKKMEELAEGEEIQDLLAIEAKAERDMLESIEKEAAKHKNKKSRLIDPLKLATEIHDLEIADYQPSTKWEAENPTEKQKAILAKHGINVDAILNKGHASLVLDRIFKRHKLGLSTIKQVDFMQKLGYSDGDKLTRDEAKSMIDSLIAKKRNHHK